MRKVSASFVRNAREARPAKYVWVTASKEFGSGESSITTFFWRDRTRTWTSSCR